MPTLCLSDLHLHDDEQPYLFTSEKERVFCALAGELDAAGGRLALCGDILDLTGMNPPEKGLAAFFSSVLGKALPDRAKHRSVADRVVATHTRFPGFFAALRPFAAAGRLTLLPGNHDCELLTDEGRQALAGAIGVSLEQITFASDVVLDGGVAIYNHGHEFDPANLTPGGHWHNPGAALTAVLYQALMPALEAMGVDRKFAKAVPAVRPEENVVAGIQRLVGDQKKVGKLLVGFVVLLYQNGYFKEAAWYEKAIASGGWLTDLVVTPERVRAALRDEGGIKDLVASKAEEVRKRANPPPRVVVMGHTHDFDGRSQKYVNLGTWIDHMTGLSDGEIDQRDQSLPVLRVDETRAEVYDARDLLAKGKLTSCARLWSAG